MTAPAWVWCWGAVACFLAGLFCGTGWGLAAGIARHERKEREKGGGPR